MFYKKIVFNILILSFTACGSYSVHEAPTENNPPVVNSPTVVSLPPVGDISVLDDNAIIRARAVFEVTQENNTVLGKLFNKLFPIAYAATGSMTVTYTNAAAVNFTLNTTAMTPSGFTGDTLNLGSITLASLDDNNLKLCNPGGNTKCNNAAIRMYTTGAVAGFVHTTDNYGVPLYAGTLNPTTALGLTNTGSVNVQTLVIPGSKKRVRITDFPTPTYSVSSDFSNAGAGNYSAVLVVEYVLLP